MTNTILLKQYLDKKHFTMRQIADRLNIAPSTLSRKINNKNEFKTEEISRIQKLLNLTNKERDVIFFSHGVDLKLTERGKYDV